VPIEGLSQGADRVRERVIEVAVAAVAEAMASHVDRGAEAAGVEERREVRALARRQ
jgi:hypothetical protein